MYDFKLWPYGGPNRYYHSGSELTRKSTPRAPKREPHHLMQFWGIRGLIPLYGYSRDILRFWNWLDDAHSVRYISMFMWIHKPRSIWWHIHSYIQKCVGGGGRCMIFFFFFFFLSVIVIVHFNFFTQGFPWWRHRRKKKIPNCFILPNPSYSHWRLFI